MLISFWFLIHFKPDFTGDIICLQEIILSIPGRGVTEQQVPVNIRHTTMLIQVFTISVL